MILRAAILWFVIARVICAQSEPAEAMQHARKAYELARAGQTDSAIAEMRESVRLAPGNALYRSALGGIYERQGNLELAVVEFAEAVRLDPINSKVKEHLEAVSLEWGATLARERRFRAGLTHAKATAVRFPQSSQAHIMLGLFETRNQQNVAAVSAYRRALQLDPKSLNASAGLGMALSNAGLTKEASAVFEAGIRAFPSDATHRQAYGVLLVKMAEAGQSTPDRGVAMLESALALDATLTEAHYQLGSIALSKGDAAAAERHFAAAAQGGLDDSRIHYAMARALRRLDRTSEAAQHLKLFEQRKQSETAGSVQ